MEHLLKLSSLTPDEIIHILDVADEYKHLHKAGTDPKDLQGKAIALMFGKHSTRTRTSFEVGVYQLGGLITGEIGFNFFTIVAAVVLVGFIYLLVRPNKYAGDNEVKIDISKI